jgi:hypothetical protein
MKLEEGGRILDWDLRVIDEKMTCVISKFVAQQDKKHKNNR